MSWMCKDDRDWSSPISIKGKSSWEDNIPAEPETTESDCDDNTCHKEVE